MSVELLLKTLGCVADLTKRCHRSFELPGATRARRNAWHRADMLYDPNSAFLHERRRQDISGLSKGLSSLGARREVKN
jgi:hypothetical protein